MYITDITSIMHCALYLTAVCNHSKVECKNHRGISCCKTRSSLIELFGPLMIHIVMRNYLIELWAVAQVLAKTVVLDLEFIIGEYPWLNTNHRLCIVFQNCSLRLLITDENNLFVCTQYPAWRTRFFQWLVQNDGLTVQRAWSSAALWFEWEKVPEKVKSKSSISLWRF